MTAVLICLSSGWLQTDCSINHCVVGKTETCKGTAGYLGVNHERPARAAGHHHPILHRERVCWQASNGPVAHILGVCQEGSKIEFFRRWQVQGFHLQRHSCMLGNFVCFILRTSFVSLSGHQCVQCTPWTRTAEICCLCALDINLALKQTAQCYQAVPEGWYASGKSTLQLTYLL